MVFIYTCVEASFRSLEGHKACNFIEKISKSTYFEEHLHTADSEVTLGIDCLGLSFWAAHFKSILT